MPDENGKMTDKELIELLREAADAPFDQEWKDVFSDAAKRLEELTRA